MYNALIHLCCNVEVVYTSLLSALCTITFVEVVSLPNKLKIHFLTRDQISCNISSYFFPDIEPPKPKRPKSAIRDAVEAKVFSLPLVAHEETFETMEEDDCKYHYSIIITNNWLCICVG